VSPLHDNVLAAERDRMNVIVYGYVDDSLRRWMHAIQAHAQLSTTLLHPLQGTLAQVRIQAARRQSHIERQESPPTKKLKLAQSGRRTSLPYSIEVVQW
jgi:hypothetical protein